MLATISTPPGVYNHSLFYSDMLGHSKLTVRTDISGARICRSAEVSENGGRHEYLAWFPVQVAFSVGLIAFN